MANVIETNNLSNFHYMSFSFGSLSLKLPCWDFTFSDTIAVGDTIAIPHAPDYTPVNVSSVIAPASINLLPVVDFTASDGDYQFISKTVTTGTNAGYISQLSFCVTGGTSVKPTTATYRNGGLVLLRNTINNKCFCAYIDAETVNPEQDTITKSSPYFYGTFTRTYNFNLRVRQADLTFYEWSTNRVSEPDTDPYVDGGGSSGGGGGEGTFDDTSDTISIPSLPSISGLNTGFFTAFVCTQAQLQNVSNYLWTDVISDILDINTGLGEKVDALKKMVTSPYDAIMGCSLVPVSPPTGGSKDLKMYGVIDTGITLPYASSRWVEVDCGTLNIQEHWGSYLDYSPYTKTTSLYLPYIGVVSVDIDLIMAKALQVVYHVDILTGICIAYIVVDGSVKFQYQGHCSTTIPVTASDYSGAIQSGLGLVGNIANVVSSGVSGGLSGGLGGATLGAVGSAISQAPSVASNVMGMKPDIKSGGGVGSSGGILGVQKPFLIIERPKQSVPAFQNGFSGYPCNMTMKLSDLTGYTEVERINLTNISLTEDEKNELYEILESGVYL